MTPEDPPTAVWIALAITFSGVVGLVMALVFGLKLYFGGPL